jgi:hypothetical protein
LLSLEICFWLFFGFVARLRENMMHSLVADPFQLRNGAVLRCSITGFQRCHVNRHPLSRICRHPHHESCIHSYFRYDERLRRWGGDKQSHAFELASKSFEFFVVPLAGIVHQPHASTKFWSRDSNILCAEVEN